MPDLSLTAGSGDRRKTTRSGVTLTLSLGLVAAILALWRVGVIGLQDIDSLKASKLDKAVYDSATARREERDKRMYDLLDRIACRQTHPPAECAP